ncbi:MAG: hypothetical protein R2834_10085 [Rhodothermales bacterium]
MNQCSISWRSMAGFALLIGLFFFATPQAVLAQRGGFGDPAERAARMKAQTDELVTALGVTGDLETQVRGILENQQKERMALMETYMGSGERNPETMQKMRAEMQDLEKGTRDELATLLTAEQMATYDKKVAEMRPRGGPGGRRGPGGANEQ